MDTKCCGCGIKSCFKFCLVYFTTLLLSAIVFTVIYTGDLTPGETTWWWAFLATLLLAASISITILVALIYIDSGKEEAQANIIAGLPPERAIKSPTYVEPSASNSFKTVLTINSTAQAGEKTAPPDASQFVNLTPPTLNSPVTVIDLPTLNAQKRENPKKAQKNMMDTPNKTLRNMMDTPNTTLKNLMEPSNLGAIPSNTLADRNDTVKRRKKKKKQKNKPKKKRTE